MKKLPMILFLSILSASAYAGEMASVEYVHNYVAAKTGITVARNTGGGDSPSMPANALYLLAVIDKLNESSPYSTGTDYKNHQLADEYAVDINNVWDAAGRLFNCKAGGYYKSGTISMTDGTGGVSCQQCPQNYYCPASSSERTACNTGFATAAAGKTAATDCTRACVTADIAGSYAVSGTINQTQTPSASCTLTSCAAQYYKNGNACTSCANGCSTNQNCTPTGCAVTNGTCVFTNTGTQTRSAACTNGANNTAGLTCAGFGACSAGTTKNVTCNSGYTPQNQGTASAACVVLVISSATTPTSCSSYTSTQNVNENSVSGCTGGSAGGSTVSSFVIGGYCSANVGQGSFVSNPQVQDCIGCNPATSSTGLYCYCKIHGINGSSVVSSSKFVYRYNTLSADACKSNCPYFCAMSAQENSNFRSVLFSAVGQ